MQAIYAAIQPHLPVLQVIVPMIAAPVCAFFFPRPTWPWLITVFISWVTFIISILLLSHVLDHGVWSYHMGGFAPPMGIEFRVDTLNAFVALIVAGIGALVATYAKRSVDYEIEPILQPYFYTAYLLCLAGLLGVTLTGDAFNLFVFLEISSLATYVLVSLGARRDRRALTAAFSYLILGTIGATFYVIGIGMTYSVTGTLNMADLAARLPDLVGNRTVIAAFAFITLGLALKLAMFPLHIWLPNAYSYAPSVVTAFLAATATKVALYALMRYVFTVFAGVDTGPADLESLRGNLNLEGRLFTFVLLPLGLIPVIVASLVACFQINLKRVLAYSSVAQIGYMLIGLAMMTKTGLTATVLHLFNHAIIKGALFLALGAVVLKVGAVTVDRIRGLAHEMPWTFAAIVGGGLSLIGVPGTVGFVSKWYLIRGAIELGWWPAAVLILVGSLIAVVYVWRMVEAAYIEKPTSNRNRVSEAPLSLLAPTWILVILNIYFGVDASLTTSIAEQAASALMHFDPGTPMTSEPPAIPELPAGQHHDGGH